MANRHTLCLVSARARKLIRKVEHKGSLPPVVTMGKRVFVLREWDIREYEFTYVEGWALEVDND